MNYTDFVIKVKNAKTAGKPIVKTDATKMSKAIAELLVVRGFVKGVEVKGKGVKKYLEIDLEGKKKIHAVKFLSTPSRHRHAGYKDFKKVKNGFGMLVVSTPKGVMTGESARKEKVGGELMFEIW